MNAGLQNQGSQSLLDPLTQLFSRAVIRERIHAAIHCKRMAHRALLLLDLDRFKLVNDSLGHDLGDQLLQQTGLRVGKALGHTNADGVQAVRATAARLYGDEFAVLLENLEHAQDAFAIANRLLDVLEAPYDLADVTVFCTASIGVVLISATAVTPDAVLRDANFALYEAKAAGKSRIVVFEPSMYAKMKQRLIIESDLRVALAQNELLLVYQPIVSVRTGQTQGFEALVRWKHPQRGLIPPLDFLPVAEESGLIIPLGTWVLDRACHDFASWRNSSRIEVPAKIHVNISRKQLQRDLVGKVTSALRAHDVNPECLHLEVTESEIMHNPEVAKSTLQELRQLGVKIDMDDFGTGHSSLSCLQELPIDVLKIDRSFIANMERSHSFAALVHAVITLGQNLGLAVIAEGIETASQLAMLQFMECESGQGYFFAKPMPADELIDYLRQTARPTVMALETHAQWKPHTASVGIN